MKHWFGIFWTMCMTTGWSLADSAKDIIEQSGVRGGLVVHIGSGEGERTAQLRIDDRFLVQGLDTDLDNVLAT
ncbi:MAG: hypothetical protein AAF492_19415, partial [Verrucomicrobiota bacterium]